MRQQVYGVSIGVPMASVEVVAVFWQTCKVADSEIAAAAWPVGVVWSRFAEIVISSPYELSYNPRIVLLASPVVVRKIAP